MTGPRLSIIPAAAASDTALDAFAYRLLGIIAAYANKAGESWPSVKNLAADMGRTERRVQSLLKELGQTPYLTITRRHSRTSLYQIHLSQPRSPTSPRSTVSPRSPASLDPEAPRREPRSSASPKKDITKDTKKDTKTNDQFEEFWKTLPSRGNNQNPKKPARDKFFAAVKKGADPEAIIRGAKNYAAIERNKGTEKQYLASARNWLRDERWKDCEAAPSIGRRESDPQPWSPNAI